MTQNGQEFKPSSLLGEGNMTFKEMLFLIKEDWEAHRCDWTRTGFRAIAIHRFGVWRMTVEPKLLRAPFSILYRSLYCKVRNYYGIDLPYTVKLGRRVKFEHPGGVIIHGNAVIGDDCVIRQGVTLGNRHLNEPFAAPVLGDRVNVGAGAKLLGNITIGTDVNIGANAVVLCDVPTGMNAVGFPAKIIEPRHSKAKLDSEMGDLAILAGVSEEAVALPLPNSESALQTTGV